MDRKDLAKALRDRDVRDDLYALFDEDRWEAVHVEQVEQGWLVSYWERGIRSSPRTFSTEDEACQYVLGYLGSNAEFKNSWPVVTREEWEQRHL